MASVRHLVKRAVTQFAIVIFVGIGLLILHSVPWAQIVPIILAVVATLVAIFFFLYWRNRVTFIWQTDLGTETRTINRLLCRSLETHFSGVLNKRGFKLISENEFDNGTKFWIVMFRSKAFELQIGGRGEVLVAARPVKSREEWYSIPVVFALLDGNDRVMKDEDNLGQLAQLIDERYYDLCDFFSPQSKEARLKYAQREEKEYWRRWGRDSVPKDAA